jgi:hypothetical protein
MNEIDIMGNNFALSQERESIGYFSEKQVDMSAFLVQVVTKDKDNSNDFTWQDAFRFVEPFSGGVWLALFVCMVVSGLVVYILDWSFYVERREVKKIEAPGKSRLTNEKGIITRKSAACNGNVVKQKQFEMVAKYDNAAEECFGGSDQQMEVEEYDIENLDNHSLHEKMHNVAEYLRQKNEDDDSYDSDDEDFGSRKIISVFDSFYLAFASFTGAESFSPVSKPSKIFVGSWSLLILIIVATYTANLAATLTRNDTFVEPIQKIDDAIKLKATTCVSTKNVYYESLPKSYGVAREIDQLFPYYLEVDGLWEDMYELLKDGTCRVALFNREDITASLQNQDYCDLLVVSEHYMSGVYHWHYSRWQ